MSGGIDSTLSAVVLFGSVILHELAHSIVARMHKIEVKKIILLPIGGMAMIEEFALSPDVELKVAVAGPLLNFILVALAMFFEMFAAPNSYLLFLLGAVKESNLLLGTFNLLPAIPLDGGRIWRSLLYNKLDHLEATRRIVRLSKGVIAMLVAVSFFFAVLFDALGFLLWNALIAFFILIGSETELDAALFKAASEGLRVRDVITRNVVCANGEETLEDVFSLALSTNVRNLLIVNEGYSVVNIANFEKVPRKMWQTKKARELATRQLSCAPSDSALDVWKRMRATGIEVMPVIENSVLAGIVSESDIERFIYLKKIALIS